MEEQEHSFLSFPVLILTALNHYEILVHSDLCRFECEWHVIALNSLNHEGSLKSLVQENYVFFHHSISI